MRRYNHFVWSIPLLAASPAIAGTTFDFTADIYGQTADSGQLAAGYGSHTVLDLYLTNHSGDDLKLLNLFNMNISLDQGSFVHDDDSTGGNWSASFNQYGRNMAIDSFVTMGGMDGSNPFVSTLDLNFDGTDAGVVSANAGWYNADPNNGQGLVDAGDRVMVGRFVIMNTLATDATFTVSGELSYNFQVPGVYFDSDSQVFTMPSVVPAPVGMLAFAAFGLAGRGRRR